MGRVLCADVRAAALDVPVAAGQQVLAGSPTASICELADTGGVGVGVWEMTAGEVSDVEADEVFVVVSGRGRLTLGDGTLVELCPGAVVRLDAGERTVWSVTEPVRKVYLTLR